MGNKEDMRRKFKQLPIRASSDRQTVLGLFISLIKFQTVLDDHDCCLEFSRCLQSSLTFVFLQIFLVFSLKNF